MKIIFSYTKDNSIIIRRVLSASGDVTVPAFIAGKPVTELSAYAFSRSELNVYDNAFIFNSEDSAVIPVAYESMERLDKSEEVICGRLSSIALPETLIKIGRYAFYNCDMLSSIKMYSTTIDLGFGLFTGCTGVRLVDIAVSEDRRSALNDVLIGLRYPLKLIYRENASPSENGGAPLSSDFSDLSGDLLPECTNAGLSSSLYKAAAENTEGKDNAPSEAASSEKSFLLEETRDNNRGAFTDINENAAEAFELPVKYRLVFPEYYENSKENTPARITVRDMQGSGYMYRNCFANTKFQIKKYDSLFPFAEALESEEVVCELALCRLETPFELTEEAKERYASYLKFHAAKLTELLIKHFENDEISIACLRNIASMEFVTEEYSSRMIETASRLKSPEALAVLMDIRHEKGFAKSSDKAVESEGSSDNSRSRNGRRRRFTL